MAILPKELDQHLKRRERPDLRVIEGGAGNVATVVTVTAPADRNSNDPGFAWRRYRDWTSVVAAAAESRRSLEEPNPPALMTNEALKTCQMLGVGAIDLSRTADEGRYEPTQDPLILWQQGMIETEATISC